LRNHGKEHSVSKRREKAVRKLELPDIVDQT